MKFYRLSMLAEQGTHAGYSFHTSLAEARKARAEWASGNVGIEIETEIKAIEITPTKAGILAALNEYASHADNG